MTREIGWYATGVCWDAIEGIFPYALYWDGVAWAERYPVILVSPYSFENKGDAKRFLDQYDPETSELYVRIFDE